MLNLIASPTSPYVRKVRIALAEKQVSYDLVRANPFEKSPEFLRLSPLGRIKVRGNPAVGVTSQSVR